MITLEKRLAGDVVILDVTGPIDGSESCRLIHEAIKEGLAAGRRKFVLELKGVEWINSLGIGIVAAAASSACRSEAALCLADLTPRVSAILRTCRLVPHVLKDCADERAAVASFR